MVEIIPKPAQKSPLWINILFYLSLGLLLLTIISYFAFGQFQKKAKETLGNDNALMASIYTPEKKALAEELKGIKRKVDDFSLLINTHQDASKLFSFLEEVSHPKVYFSGFRFDAKENKAVISCQTENFSTLGEQIFILKNEKRIKEISLSGISMGKEGKVIFEVSLTLDTQIFK